MQTMFFNYRDASKNIKSDHLQGYGQMVGDVSYELAPTKEIQRVSNKLRKSLELPHETVNNEETKLNRLNERQGFSFDYEGDTP